MTYNVLMGTLNPTHSLTHYLIKASEFHCMVSCYCFRYHANISFQIQYAKYWKLFPSVFLGLFCGYTHSWKMKKKLGNVRDRRTSQVDDAACCLAVTERSKTTENLNILRAFMKYAVWKFESSQATGISQKNTSRRKLSLLATSIAADRIPQMVNARNTGV